jgi:hypothetical protein
MQITDLARSLGISRQMVYKLRDKGMPTDNVQVAVEWRKRNIDPFRSKALRIDGNQGVKYQSPKVNKSASIRDRVYNEAGGRIFEETLTDTVPNLYFERVDWLAVALKDAGVPVTGAQIMEIQDNLFSTYLEEIVYGHFQIDSHFDLPPISLMRLDSPERKAVIASLDKILSEELTL